MKTLLYDSSRLGGARAQRAVPRTLIPLFAGLAVLLTEWAVTAADTIHFGSAGAYDTEGNAQAVAVSGSYAYVAASSAGLVIFDISDPTHLRRVAVADTSGTASHVVIADPYAYVADGESGLQIIDVADPTAPRWVGGIDTSGSARRVAVAGPYAYVADGSHGLQIVDVSNPSDPRLVAEYKAVGYTQDVAVSGRYAYLAQGTGGLHVLDVSNPTDPRLVGSAQVEGLTMTCLALGATHAYGGVPRQGMQIIDIADPTRPQLVSRHSELVGMSSAVVTGDGLYVACGWNGLRILDVTDPVHPVAVGGYEGAVRAVAFGASGDYLYAATRGPSLEVRVLAPAVFAKASYSVPEDAPSISIAVNRTSAFQDEVIRVQYWTQDGTATGGEDYIVAVGELLFEPGEFSKPLEIGILNDRITEGLEKFSLHLGILEQGLPLLLFSTTEITILDNDLGIRFAQAATTVSEAAGEVVLRVLRGNDVDLAPFNVEFRSEDVTATAGADYQPVSGLLEFGEGDTERAITLTILNDALREGDETFRVVLSNPTGPSSLGSPAVATVTILDNDPGIRFAQAATTVSEAAGEVVLRVLRGNDVDLAPFSVEFRSEDVTATAGADYQPVSGLLEFGEGDTERAITLTILNDALREGDESFRVVLSNPTGPSNLGSPAVATFTILDNDPGIHFAQITYSFREDAGAVELTVVRGNDFELPPITVDFATRDGSAVAGEDYVAAAGTLSFGEGEERQTLGLQLLDDQVAEPREVFHVVLSNPTGGAQLGGPSTCTVMIEVDDARVTLGVLGQIGGWSAIRLEDAWGLDVAGHTAYVGDGSAGVRIVDFSVPSLPREIARHDTAGHAYGVAVRDDYLYVGDGGQLLVLDVSNPGQPQAVGSWQAAANALGVAVADHYVYVADGSAGLQILDVSDPSSPRVVGNYDTPGGAEAVAVENALAYVADGEEGLQIVDVSDPAQPQGVSAWKTSGSAWGVAVSGQHAYLACTNGLHIVDVSDPSDPQGIAEVELTGARDVIIERGYAWVAHADGLAVIELTEPHRPVQVANAPTDAEAWGVALAWPYALVTDWVSGSSWLYIIDVSTPTDPQRLSGPASGRSINDVAVAGDYALVAAGQQGLEVINLADPLSLERVGQCSTPGWAVVGVVHQGDRAYVADGQGLQVIDVTHPADPRRLGGTETPGYARAVAVQGDYAYVADGDAGLQVIEVTNPAQPRVVGATDTPGTARSVAVQGDCAYVTCAGDGEAKLQVIAISDPTRPQLQGRYLVPDGTALEVVVSGNFAYLAAGQAGLQVIDVADPAQPRWLSTYELGWVRSVAVWRDYVLVGHNNGLEIIDVRDPVHPVWAGGLESVPVQAIAVSGNRVLLATGPYYLIPGEQGLIILRATEVPAFDAFVVGLTGITLRWNSGAEGMLLQRSPSLDPPIWQTVPDSANTNCVTLPLEGGSQFFRLRKP